MSRLYRVVFYFYFLCTLFLLPVSEVLATSKEREECRIKATIAQDTNVIYDVDLTPQNEALVVGPEYYNLSYEQKEDLTKAYNCMMVKELPNAPQRCLNFSLKDYKTNEQVASFINCQFISK